MLNRPTYRQSSIKMDATIMEKDENDESVESMQVLVSESWTDLTRALINPIAMDEGSSVYLADGLTIPVALLLTCHGLDGVGVEPVKMDEDVKPVSFSSAQCAVPHPPRSPDGGATVATTCSTRAPSMLVCIKRMPPQLLVARRYCSFFHSFISFVLQFNECPSSSFSFSFITVPKRSVCHQRRKCMNSPCLQSTESRGRQYVGVMK